MPISGIVSSAGLTPQIEHPGKETKPAEQRVTVSQIAASLPGGGEQAESEEWDLDGVVAGSGIVGFEQALDRRLQFVVDHQSNELIVKVIDNATEEVVRVLPPEEMQRLQGNLHEAIGFLLNEHA